jgi:hypothetical protein
MERCPETGVNDVSRHHSGGRGGIRTHERVAPLTVFKTVAFVRSATLPAGSLVMAMNLGNGLRRGGLRLLGLADTG